MTTRPLVERTWPLVGIAGIITAVGGYLSASGGSLAAAGVVGAGILVVLALRRFGSGLAAGLLLLGTLDALPGPSLEQAYLPVINRALSATALKATDLCALLLIAVLAAKTFGQRGALTRSSLGRWIVLWSGVLLLLWLFAVIRVWYADDISLLDAAVFGRDFLYFALIVPLAIVPLSARQFSAPLISVMAIGAVVASLGQLALFAAHVNVPFFLHTLSIQVQFGATRLYSDSTYLVSAGFPLGLGLLLLGDRRYQVAIGGLVTIITALAIAVELTRASYVGAIVGASTGLIFWVLVPDAAGKLGRLRLSQITAVIAVGVILIVVYAPTGGVGGNVGVIASRATSTVGSVGSSSTKSTVAVRVREVSDLEQALSGRWLLGLGFLNPDDHYDPHLFEGTIRNSDTGVFNVIMTMGIIGTIVYYVPLLGVALGLLRRRLVERRVNDWIAFWLFAWIVSSLVSSATLVSLFSPAGSPLAAVLVAGGVASLLAKPNAHHEQMHSNRGSRIAALAVPSHAGQ